MPSSHSYPTIYTFPVWWPKVKTLREVCISHDLPNLPNQCNSVRKRSPGENLLWGSFDSKGLNKSKYPGCWRRGYRSLVRDWRLFIDTQVGKIYSLESGFNSRGCQCRRYANNSESCCVPRKNRSTASKSRTCATQNQDFRKPLNDAPKVGCPQSVLLSANRKFQRRCTPQNILSFFLERQVEDSSKPLLIIFPRLLLNY